MITVRFAPELRFAPLFPVQWRQFSVDGKSGYPGYLRGSNKGEPNFTYDSISIAFVPLPLPIFLFLYSTVYYSRA